MTDLDSRREVRVHPVVRRIAGVLVATAAATLLVLFALGTWNPWDSVVLTSSFGNPTFGLAMVAALTLLASWLLAPIRNEATQARRGIVRVVSAVALVLGLLSWGLVGGAFSVQTDVIARSADQDRSVVVVLHGRDDRQLHIWSGRGLATRDRGALGIACGEVTASFLGHDEVQIVTSYGTWQLRLDPATGRPLDRLGPRCSGGR
ncbi:MAG TPA: hypothetical protein VFE14_03265 [Micromonosporaceae bacterium]|nr:hypothetical protein [Micromonosporaceae bacterium]